MKPYLIQRAEISDSGSKGLDSIIRIAYMGSSEFEWGALPESLKRIRNERKYFCFYNLPVLNATYKTKTITVFCKKSQKSELKEYLKSLADDTAKLKEWSGFNRYINNEKPEVNFWWDIENDVMFWEKNVAFEEKFNNVIMGKTKKALLLEAFLI